ncbi:hypothetical protein FHR83_005061 [Actinoplanes campanulatus]|uniref:Uncharacterized protein n=1 Tax=Actinoplanes campanulatus TaxID=113559 RepID=A0A7W5AJD9_9ACTN|nr:hypothetical protein [Actinoplanes campanulatus]MBB3097383.1 hypothetical protein [Actinoplanes campanulatus]
MISDRLQAYVSRRFAPDEVEPVLGLLAEAIHGEPGDTPEGTERIQAAVVLVADGSSQRFLHAVSIAQGDWRDILVWADLAHKDWADRLKAELS